MLFLFVVMMLDVDFVQLRSGFQRYLPVGAAVGALLLAELVFVMAGWQFHPAVPQLRFAPAPTDLPNTVALGRLIYTDYILLFQTAGLVLLVAMIGAIVLTLRDRRRSRHQVIRVQTAREEKLSWYRQGSASAFVHLGFAAGNDGARGHRHRSLRGAGYGRVASSGRCPSCSGGAVTWRDCSRSG